MDTKSGVRHRRQERIRRIMEEQQNLAKPPSSTAKEDRNQKLPIPLQEVKSSRDSEYSPGSVPVDRLAERDPERDWKERTSPWENAGWNMTTKLAPKGERASVKSGGPGGGTFIRGLFIQTIIAGILFVIVFAMYKLDHPIAKKGQQIVTAALTDTLDFQSAAEWYRSVFAGAPSFIPIFDGSNTKQAELAEGDIELPTFAPLKQGTIVRSFAETLSGVDIAGNANEDVLASETGRVLLVSEDEKTGKTVVIQHANQRVTVYGMLEETQVALNDWVEAGRPIGKLKAAADGENSLLFFAVKEKGRYVNPADVFPID
ncbi:M23 family metallopeptidase [Paenibacillus mendelii]|uniref:Peptidoglycan DD-metalloendopeptidase family protein n=1 Tax=Paenibacillus mendelii TaxID=206163 RepID=A0ABV6JA36_9BACL|nr:M23 family metallopeptidase [Paenibacillus mendelii]MCQ6560865.1 M23 family metallopeptidase [Paenibacillus mendelii]